MPLPVLRRCVVLGTGTHSHGDPLPLRSRGSHLDGNCLGFFFQMIALFQLCWAFVAAGGLSLVSVRRGSGSSVQWLLLLQRSDSRAQAQ